MSGLIYGAMAGMGEAGERAGLTLQKTFSDENLLRMRAEADQAMARTMAELARETHAANIETDIAAAPRRFEAELPGKKALMSAEADARVDTARRSPRTLAAGASEIQDGRIIATAPEKPLPREQLAYYTAQANRLNAEAAAIRDGIKYRGEKVAVPNIKVETLDRDGVKTIVNVDQNSGAIGVVMPGAPATPGKSRWFSPDEPGKPEGPPSISWSLNGRALPGGLSDLYPAMKARIGDQGEPGRPPGERDIALLRARPDMASEFDRKFGPGASDRVLKRSGWDSETKKVFVDGREIGTAASEAEAKSLAAKAKAGPDSAGASRAMPRPSLDSFFKQPKEAPASVEPDIPGGEELDAAKDRLNAAYRRMQTFGLVQRRTNAKEFEAAQKELADAQQAEIQARAAYDKAFSRGGAARFRTQY